jgi:hypothetical protein
MNLNFEFLTIGINQVGPPVVHEQQVGNPCIKELPFRGMDACDLQIVNIVSPLT